MRRPSLLVRLLRAPRSGDGRAVPAAPASPVAPGPRREEWLVVGDGVRPRGARLAEALAERGCDTTFVSRGAGPVPIPSSRLVVREAWDLAALRREQLGRPDRLRVVIGVADAETIALARDLAADGARVAYDAPAPSGAPAGVLSYDAETERALVGVAWDLIGGDTRTARHVSSLAGGRRIVHVVPDAASDSGWSAVASTLVGVGARPAVTVVLAGDAAARSTLEAASAFEAARADGAYRLVVVIAADEPDAETLEAWETDGRIGLFRSARSGRAAFWNLGFAATRSEVVALVDARQRPAGAGWLRPALAVLADRREVGAVGLRDGWPTKSGSASQAAALDGAGLVAPRGVLRRAGGFDESAELEGVAAVDLSFRIRDLGYDLAIASELGLRDEGDLSPGPTREAEHAIRRRWARRPGYLAGRAGPG